MTILMKEQAINKAFEVLHYGDIITDVERVVNNAYVRTQVIKQGDKTTIITKVNGEIISVIE